MRRNLTPLEALNALKDPRHYLHNSVFEPTKEEELLVVRCDCCNRLCTDAEVYMYSSCPWCGKTKFHGGYPSFFERLWLYALMFFHSWRIDLKKAEAVRMRKEKRLLKKLEGSSNA